MIETIGINSQFHVSLPQCRLIFSSRHSIANNILTGEIPSEVGSLSSLQDLVLGTCLKRSAWQMDRFILLLFLIRFSAFAATDGNRLRGEIPSDIAQLQSLTKLVLGKFVINCAANLFCTTALSF